MTPRSKSRCFIFATVYFLALLPQLPGTAAGGCGCPPLWTTFQNHCYRFFTSQNLSWMEAELRCLSFTVPCSEDDSAVTLGHLASVHSQKEMDFLKVMYESVRTKRVETRVWIGLHDRTTEETREWTDGTAFNFTYWATNQPNDAGGHQDCTYFGSAQDYRWSDSQCTTNSQVESFICKLPKW